MSLLDGRHTLLVTPQMRVGDPVDGERLVDGPTVRVRCNVQPVSEERSAALGLASRGVYRVSCRRWPAGAYWRAEWLEGGFELSYAQANPKVHRMSGATSHDVVYGVTEGPHG